MGDENRRAFFTSPLLWLRLMLTRERPWGALSRKLRWHMLHGDRPGAGNAVSLPPGVKKSEVAVVLDRLAEADRVVDEAKQLLVAMIERLPEDHGATMGFAERFEELAHMDKERAELLRLLIARAQLMPQDHDLLARALASIESRMNEYVNAEDAELEARATVRALVLERALSEGLELQAAEDAIRERWS